LDEITGTLIRLKISWITKIFFCACQSLGDKIRTLFVHDDKRLRRAYKNLREGVRDFFIGPGWHRGPVLFHGARISSAASRSQSTSPTRQSGPTYSAIREKPAPHWATSDPRQNLSRSPLGMSVSSTSAAFTLAAISFTAAFSAT
jgi:hypothetical protein